jgi:archaellum biogenesis ATPase FlaH
MLLQALSNFLGGKEGGILHLSHDVLTGKNTMVFSIIEGVIQINPNMKFFYCDSNANFPKKTYKKYASQIYHSQVKDCERLGNLLNPMQFSPVFRNQVVVIDSISDLFRGAKGDSYCEYREATASFAEEILNRINLISIKNNVHFILIHQMSYRPELGCKLPVEEELMNFAQGIWLKLTKEIVGEADEKFIYRYNAHISYQYRDGYVEKDFPYELSPLFRILPPLVQCEEEGEITDD